MRSDGPHLAPHAPSPLIPPSPAESFEDATRREGERPGVSSRLRTGGAKGERFLIEVQDLRVRYGTTEAVRGVSFQVARGEVCGYLGPNGAGKSSTVKAVAGILTPEAGSIRIAGFDMRGQKLEAQRRLGYAPEDAAAFTLLTGKEYLELVADLYELPEDSLAARHAALLERLDLGKVAMRPIATYSKGQRQKICLAAALLHDPEVLILDEPLSGLDAHAVRTVKDIISERAAAGAAVLFVSHMLEVVERVCSRVVILSQGVVVADRPTADLLAAAKDRTLESVFLELTGKGRTAEAAAAAEALAGTGGFPSRDGGGQAPAPRGQGGSR